MSEVWIRLRSLSRIQTSDNVSLYTGHIGEQGYNHVCLILEQLLIFSWRSNILSTHRLCTQHKVSFFLQNTSSLLWYCQRLFAWKRALRRASRVRFPVVSYFYSNLALLCPKDRNLSIRVTSCQYITATPIKFSGSVIHSARQHYCSWKSFKT